MNINPIKLSTCSSSKNTTDSNIEDTEENTCQKTTEENKKSCDQSSSQNKDGNYEFMKKGYYEHYLCKIKRHKTPNNQDKCQHNQNPCNQNSKKVAASEYGYITGEPHLRGGDGETYDIKGAAGDIYSVLQDKGIDYNVKYGTIADWQDVGVTESAITTYGQDCKTVVTLNKDGKATLISTKDGKTTETQIERGKTYNLADGGTVKYGQALGGGTDGSQMEERLILTSAEGYIVTQAARSPGYIDANVETSADGVFKDKTMPSGLIGDTFDQDSNTRTASDSEGTGILNNDISQYKRSSLY